MRIIYSYINCYGASYDMSEAFYNAQLRTNINLYPFKGGYGVALTNATFGRSNIEVLNISSFLHSKNISYFLTNSHIKYIIVGSARRHGCGACENKARSYKHSQCLQSLTFI